MEAMDSMLTGREQEIKRIAIEVQIRVIIQLITLMGILRFGLKKKEKQRKKQLDRNEIDTEDAQVAVNIKLVHVMG